MIGLARSVPLVGMSLVGGAVADAVDRRKLLMARRSLARRDQRRGLALNACWRPPAWPLYVLRRPRRRPVPASTCRPATPWFPALSAGAVPAAAALGQIMFQVGPGRRPGPGRHRDRQVDLAAAYWIDVASFVVAVAAVARSSPPSRRRGAAPGPAWRRSARASRYVKGRRLLVLSTFLIDINAMVFGMPRALFPALGTGLFGGGAATVGLLTPRPGAGALVGALFTGWVGRVRRQGRAVDRGRPACGAPPSPPSGWSPWLPLGLLLLALAGAADVVSAVFRNTILQLSVPDGAAGPAVVGPHRGGHRRPRLGDAEAGAVAALPRRRGSRWCRAAWRASSGVAGPR